MADMTLEQVRKGMSECVAMRIRPWMICFGSWCSRLCASLYISYLRNVMTDLDTLRPEVREAFLYLDRFENCPSGWTTIRAELLMLAERNAALESKATRDFEWNTELLAANKQAETELAALKARIANSPIVEIANYGDPFIVLPDHFTVPDSLKGKRVRLVVEE